MGHFNSSKFSRFFLLSIAFIQQCILRANTRRLHPPAVPARRGHPRKEAKKDGSLPAARQCQASRCFGHPPAAGRAGLDYGTPPTILPRLGAFRLPPLPLPQELPARPELPKLRSPQIWIGRVLRAPACGFLGARHPGSVRTLET